MAEYDDIRILWIWLSLALGAANHNARALLELYDFSAEAIYKADDKEIAELPLFTEALKARIRNKELTPAKAIYAQCRNEGVGILTPDSPLYPSKLKQLVDMPTVLYFRGTIRDFDRELVIAVVGTRNMTDYGLEYAYGISYDLATAGGITVSGMAKGIDGIAHRATLDADGYTVAVLGCGVCRVYPSEHGELMKQIIEHGAVISEYPPLAEPTSWNFPKRNRIISALAQGTLVVEAPERSGSLITARYALEQGKDVFAAPGRAGERSSTGTNELIKNGAKMVTEATDILNEYRGLYGKTLDIADISAYRAERKRAIERTRLKLTEEFALSENVKRERKKPGKKQEEAPAAIIPEAADHTAEAEETDPDSELEVPDFSGLNDQQSAILRVIIEGKRLTPDEISAKTGISVRDVLVALTLLELYGRVEALPGGTYKLTHK